MRNTYFDLEIRKIIQFPSLKWAKVALKFNWRIPKKFTTYNILNIQGDIRYNDYFKAIQIINKSYYIF